MFSKALFLRVVKIWGCVGKLSLKVALQILGWKIYKNTKKLSLYSQSLLFFIIKPQYSKAIRQLVKLEI